MVRSVSVAHCIPRKFVAIASPFSIDQASFAATCASGRPGITINTFLMAVEANVGKCSLVHGNYHVYQNVAGCRRIGRKEGARQV